MGEEYLLGVGSDNADLTDMQKRRILADNARRFYTLA
jgi:predicted TIM-barrel fold metal-dependent hydrolase